MSKDRDEAQARAEAKFEKQQKADQAVKAEGEAQAQAVDVNTARLKSLRLAKQAAEKEAAAKSKGGTQAKAKPPATKKKRCPGPTSRPEEGGFTFVRAVCAPLRSPALGFAADSLPADSAAPTSPNYQA